MRGSPRNCQNTAFCLHYGARRINVWGSPCDRHLQGPARLHAQMPRWHLVGQAVDGVCKPVCPGAAAGGRACSSHSRPHSVSPRGTGWTPMPLPGLLNSERMGTEWLLWQHETCTQVGDPSACLQTRVFTTVRARHGHTGFTPVTAPGSCEGPGTTGTGDMSWAAAHPCWTELPGCARRQAGQPSRPGRPPQASPGAFLKLLSSRLLASRH